MATTAPPTVSPELRSLLRRLKLGRSLDTLPERLALARQNSLGHADSSSWCWPTRSTGATAPRTACAPGPPFGPGNGARSMGRHAAVSFDRALWSELTTLRFVDDAHNVLALGPVGVGKTFMATALGHRRAPAHQRPLRARRPAPQAPEGLAARRQPRRRDAQVDPRR